MRKLTLLKLGGSVITRKEMSPPTINDNIVSRIAKELQVYQNPLLIVLGGGAYGHQAAHKYGFGNPETPISRLISGIPSIRHNMSVLSLGIESIMESNGVSSVIIPPFSLVTLNSGEIQSFQLEIFKKTLEAKFTIITHGDVCYDSTHGASILSGDTILAYLSANLDVDRVLVGTNVDGFLDANPNENPNAQVIPLINAKNRDYILEIAGPSGSTDVTGGMKRKISDLLSISELGVEVTIFNLNVSGRLTALLQGKQTICTRITI